MTNRDIIVIGASAGGVETLRTLLSGLPVDLPASVFIVIHTSADAPGVLAALLDKVSQLPIAYAVHGEPIKPGRVYLAPSDHHLRIKEGAVELTHGPRENRSRPAVDPLFRSAAMVYRNRVIGVILTGNLDDGTRGLLVIKRLGGLAVVQDPEDALYTGMPRSALQHVAVDHVTPVSRMAELLAQLTREPLTEGVSRGTPRNEEDAERDDGHPRFVCPECGGSMQELKENGLLYFRCHVGHIYSAQMLLDEQSRDVEAALWTALRTLEDHAALDHRLAENAREQNLQDCVAWYEQNATDVERQAELIRKVLGL